MGRYFEEVGRGSFLDLLVPHWVKKFQYEQYKIRTRSAFEKSGRNRALG